MTDDIDRSRWGPEDFEAERQARDMASIVTGPPPPPPPDRPGIRWLERVRVRLGLLDAPIRLVLALAAIVVLSAFILTFFVLSGDDGGPEVMTSSTRATASSVASSTSVGSTRAAVSIGYPAGSYHLDVASASEAMGLVVDEFQSADGRIVVGSDGMVSGSITYWYDDGMGEDLVASVIFDGILTPVILDVVDDGFTFSTTMAVTLDITPHGEGDDVPPPYVDETSLQVLGVLDVDLGTIALSQLQDDGAGVVLFRR